MLKSLKFQALFLLFVLAITAGCNDRIEEKRDTAPWESLSYLNQANTGFSLINRSPDSISYRFSSNLEQLSRGVTEGKLGPKDSTLFEQSLFKPIRVYLEVNDTAVSGPYLMPGLHRQMQWTGNKTFDGGQHSLAYDYLRTLNASFPFRGDVSLLSLPLEDVYEHGLALSQNAIKQSEAYTSKNQVPVWLVDFYQREATLKSAAALESVRGYLAYAYADTLELPIRVHHWIDSLLDDPGNLMMPANDKVRRSHTYNEAAPPQSGMTITNRNNRLDFEGIADSFPTDNADLRHNFLAAWTENQLFSSLTYANKDELIARAREILPADYVHQLDYIRDSINARISTDGDALKLLAMTFLSASDTLTPLFHRTKPFTLYKFWFPGCRPCVKQYPFERKLLAEHPNLELVNVAYETRKDQWREYIKANDMPGSQQLYLPKQKRKAARAALGMLGAPRYLMLGPENKLICRNCPKPNDKSFASLIK